MNDLNKLLSSIKIIGSLILFSVLFCGELWSAHIVGGEMTYVCLGNGEYRVTMKVYRDCASDGALFDPQAAITVYRTDDLNDPFRNLSVPHGPITEIPPDINPCLIVPPNVCVEQTTYQFDVSLPVSNHGYVLTYQRCCRNNSITNIIDPGGTGATYTVEITPEAQATCNNSPVFNSFPPIVICANEPLVFDHSATDADGDQLVYEFCSPLDGGGTKGTPDDPGDPNAFDGVMPNPAAPPPYSDVLFQVPMFSPTNPMAGSPQISIDPNTGEITGTPIAQGQYVVGVCVKEYRNGVLIGMVRRDFQFNVAFCEPLVIADIMADEKIGDKEFLINACGNNTVNFINQSIQESNIFEYFWSFDIDGSPQTFTTRDASVTFPDTGIYQGVMMVNPGTNCGDTANIFVRVFPEVHADFSFSYDTCVAGPVDYTDLSYSEGGPLTDWLWDFDDGDTSVSQHPSHLFNSPGVRAVNLEVTDINNCKDDTTKLVTWQPAPAIIIVEPDKFSGCQPMEVFFENLSFPIDSTYDIFWDLGDGNFSEEISPTHTYEEIGIFSVSIEITSPIGCFVSADFPNWILVRASPVADFDFTPKELTSLNSTVDFIDQSQDAVFWSWKFDGDGFSLDRNPTFTFPDTGLQRVTLSVTHQSGCEDTITKLIDVVPVVSYFLPNAFTPNADDKNDFFQGAGIFAGIRNFEMTIWNRWGEQIFQTNDPTEGWNGRKENIGKMSPLGVYPYLVRYTGPRGKRFELRGFATLVR